MMLYIVRLISVLLATAVVGCQKGDQITVSGAVQNPGDYAFEAGKQASDYLEMAGGTTTEAIINEAYLVRGVPDSADVTVIHSVTLFLSENPEIVAGDEIWVPSRGYDARLDTARALHNVRLVQDGQVFKLPNGALVPGWTEHGVMVALLLGRGRVYEEADTMNAVSAFHYLYVHLHPGEYDRLAEFTGGVIDSIEALEDANAMHLRARERLEHYKDGGLYLPPKDYWQIYQGILLAPKNATLPGTGVRRRRFGDGRIWTTFPSRRQRWQYPDGRVVVAFPGGSKEERFRDGRVAYTDMQGNVRTTYADGREHWKLAIGTEVTRRADGYVIKEYTTGDVTERWPDGSSKVTYANGAVRTQRADGVVEIVDGKQKETRYPDGRRVVITEEGHEITLEPDGRQVSRLADGSVVRYNAHGGLVKEHASGRVSTITAEGLRRDVMPDGTTMTEAKDGTRVVRYVHGDMLTIRPNGYMLMKYVDGAMQETFTDGRILRKDPSGAQMEVLPDGMRIAQDRFGQQTTFWPDGKKEVRMPLAYAYPGELKTHLATVKPLPDKIAVGDELVVEGHLYEKADKVRVSAFMAPEGDVIVGDVRMQGQKFHARFRFKEEGHCRVQVQVVLPKARTFTVSHQAVTVGNPAMLEDVVLAIKSQRSEDEAEQFLIDRINQDRMEIGRHSVLPHPDLMRVAEVRLEEMLVLGEVSHFSAAGLDVSWHVFTRRLPFGRVGENVARSHFIETMHEQWMLSTGHRSNILNKRWTHVGVAVQESGGMMWGVQIFAQR